MSTKKKRRILTYLLIAVLALGFALPASAGNLDDYYDDLDLIQEELDKMKQDRKHTKSQLEQVRDELEALEREVFAAELVLEDLAEKIEQMEVLIARQESHIAQVEDSIAETEEYLAVQTEYLEKRLCSMYKNGTVSYLEVLFSASSFSDFLSRFGFIRRLVESDTELVAEIEKAKEELQADKDFLAAELEAQVQRRVQLEESRAEAESTRALLKAKAAAQAKLKKQAEAELEKQNKGIASLEADIKAIDAEIKRLLDLERVRAGDPPSFFTWPVPGFDRVPYNITSEFGWRVHPIRGTWSFHTGVDIARLNRQGGSIGGKPIVAAAGGTVDFVRSYDGGGYGIYAIISHGGGYQTLYAHMRKVLVSVGEQVIIGQQIGIVGTTGSSTGNHLHFEVIVMGERKNPLTYEYR